MKKLNKLILLIILSLILIPFSVHAGSVTVSTRSISLSPGGSSSFTITASSAAGRIDISSSNSSVASVSAGSIFLDNNSQTITVRAGSAGSATINVVFKDVASYDETVISGGYTINVNVVAPTPPPSNNNNNNNTVVNVNPKTNNKTNNNNNSNKSGNTNLKKIEVEGYKLNTNDNVNYSLNVKNSVDKIKILADAADSKASVSGAGEKTLKEGDNSFQIVVTAENGTKKTYTITITRHDSTYYLNELDEAIKEAKDSLVITLKDNDILTKEHLDKIKKAKLTAYFVRKENNKTIYSWMFDYKNISNQANINMTLSFMASNKAKLEKLTDYREGIYLNFSYHGNLPKDTIVRIYVGDKYKDGDVLNLYYLDSDTSEVTYMKQEVKVSNGYAEISIDHCSDYFLTKATISGDNVKVVSNDNSILPIIIIVLLIVLIIAVIISIFIKKGSNSKEEVVEKEENSNVEENSENVQNTEVVEEVQNNEDFSNTDNNDIQNIEPVNDVSTEAITEDNNIENSEEETTEVNTEVPTEEVVQDTVDEVAEDSVEEAPSEDKFVYTNVVTNKEESVDSTPMNDELDNTKNMETI